MHTYVIPFQYLYISRLKRISEVLSLLWIYPMYLIFFLFYLYAIPTNSHILGFVIGFIAWMAIYEIGYLENDSITIHKEKFPNLRIDTDRINFIRSNLKTIVVLRVILFGILVGANWATNLWTISQCGWFIGWVLMGRLFFSLHNSLRSRINILTYFGLCVTKYFVFPFLLLGMDYGLEPYVVILLTFPLLRTLEHAVKPKYQLVTLQQVVEGLDTFRLGYYAFALLIALAISRFFDLLPTLALSVLYFFIFRFGIWLLIRSKVYSREAI
ncbi:wbuO protein [Lunatibacter salilacus]|uniref:wbuO protein n=1 Tax=Lunatibacter salilacus TaxID=2483804 RepID=UPI00131C45C4|nr:wbuO protein [Lunatibacter salilacus]